MRCSKMVNGADGISDMDGNAATGSASESGTNEVQCGGLGGKSSRSRGVASSLRPGGFGRYLADPCDNLGCLNELLFLLRVARPTTLPRS
jgi:hypothetical protein